MERNVDMSSKKLSEQGLTRYIIEGAASISLFPNVKTETPIIENPLKTRSEGFKGDKEALRSDCLKIGQDLNKAIKKLISE